MDSNDDSNFWSDPRNFFNSLPDGYPRPDKFLTPADAKEAVKCSKEEVFNAFDRLHSILAVHESTIRKRWVKVPIFGI